MISKVTYFATEYYLFHSYHIYACISRTSFVTIDTTFPSLLYSRKQTKFHLTFGVVMSLYKLVAKEDTEQKVNNNIFSSIGKHLQQSITLKFILLLTLW